MTKSQLCLGLTCLSFGVFACEGERELLEISSAEAALTASENAELALGGVIEAADFLASSTSITQALGVLGGRGESCETSAVFCANGADCPPPETSCTPDEFTEEELEEARLELRESAAELVRQLRERVLIEENLESSTPTSATYRLKADVLCSDDTDLVAPAGAAEPVEASESGPDGDCAEQVQRLEPRLVLTSSRAGDIDATLQLGAERREPLALALYRESLGVRVDLSEGVALARDLGEDLDGLRELAGVLEWRLVKNAARDYSVELNVLEALRAVVQSDADTLSTSLAASAPAWNVRVNGNTRTLSAGFDLGALRVTGPLRLFAELFEDDAPSSGSAGAAGDPFGPLPLPEPEPAPRAYSGVVDLLLAGLSGTLSYTAESDVLAFSDLGFGDATSSFEHDGNTVFGLDLNALSGRRVNVEVRPTDEGGAELRVSPSFDLQLSFAFHHIADQFQGIADYLLDDDLRVWLAGDAPVIEVDAGRLRVSAGTLQLTSRAAPSANVEVEAGMCLASADEESSDAAESTESGEHHPLASLAAIACE